MAWYFDRFDVNGSEKNLCEMFCIKGDFVTDKRKVFVYTKTITKKQKEIDILNADTKQNTEPHKG